MDLHGTIQKGLRYGAALVLAMALCATAALAAGTEGKSMKQTVAVMAIILALLLVVSG